MTTPLQTQDLVRMIQTYLRPQQRFPSSQVKLHQLRQTLQGKRQEQRQVFHHHVMKTISSDFPYLHRIRQFPFFVQSLSKDADERPLLHRLYKKYLGMVGKCYGIWYEHQRTGTPLSLYKKSTITVPSLSVAVTMVVYTHLQQLISVIVEQGRIVRVDSFRMPITRTPWLSNQGRTITTDPRPKDKKKESYASKKKALKRL